MEISSKTIIMVEKMNKELHKLLEKNPTFTGNLKINFFLGGVANFTITESFKLEKDE